MRKLTVLVLCLLAACQSPTPSVARGPNGKRTYFLAENSQQIAFNRAANLCPRGYSLVGNPERRNDGRYAMNVECR